ncbi:response regulator transcription factor [Lentzea californiensis]|uniref:response regulator transcription factor n=1 Tax=Lentzea californiensis TaxID=438851 RepID=UPI0021652F7B|nr:response regulator transcription factor [Lentzea californiensis]MCR3749211.1 two-component system, OmpR family, response regulator [Lentzea californiensis]
MSSRGRLLVVEDEPSIRELLCASLRFAGFTVTSAATGSEALQAARDDSPDLVLLDVMLPDRDGFEVVRRLRSSGVRVPVLYLTARDGTDDRVTGLTIGGDGYITKPFSLEEVIARVTAVLRRTRPGTEQLTCGELSLDVDSHVVRRGSRVVELSPTEFRLLHYLMRNSGRVLSKAQILDQVWSHDFDGDVGVVESYISYLRRKVDGTEPRLIHTVRGLGYMIRP